MRLPGRLHITWQDDRAFKLEAEAGSQVRVLASLGGAGAPSERRRLAGQLARLVGPAPKARWVAARCSGAVGRGRSSGGGR